jgi:hypothetical protein
MNTITAVTWARVRLLSARAGEAGRAGGRIAVRDDHAILTGRWSILPARSWCRVDVRMEGGEMAVTRATLGRLAMPLNRGDFPAFVAAVERLPAADRNILAVLGAGDLLSHARARNSLMWEPTASKLQGWLLQFKQEHVSEV